VYENANEDSSVGSLDGSGAGFFIGSSLVATGIAETSIRGEIEEMKVLFQD
jgi:hypothetical protein